MYLIAFCMEMHLRLILIYVISGKCSHFLGKSILFSGKADAKHWRMIPVVSSMDFSDGLPLIPANKYNGTIPLVGEIEREVKNRDSAGNWGLPVTARANVPKAPEKSHWRKCARGMSGLFHCETGEEKR